MILPAAFCAKEAFPLEIHDCAPTGLRFVERIELIDSRCVIRYSENGGDVETSSFLVPRFEVLCQGNKAKL